MKSARPSLHQASLPEAQPTDAGSGHKLSPLHVRAKCTHLAAASQPLVGLEPRCRLVRHVGHHLRHNRTSLDEIGLNF